jgi:hypothetical protein
MLLLKLKPESFKLTDQELYHDLGGSFKTIGRYDSTWMRSLDDVEPLGFERGESATNGDVPSSSILLDSIDARLKTKESDFPIFTNSCFLAPEGLTLWIP